MEAMLQSIQESILLLQDKKVVFQNERFEKLVADIQECKKETGILNFKMFKLLNNKDALESSNDFFECNTTP